MRTVLPQQIPGPIATLYDKVATPGLRHFHRQVASEIASSLRFGKVLDVGTGPGHLLAEIARQNSDLRLTGCDLSRKMLKIAGRRLERSAVTWVNTNCETPVLATADTNAHVRLLRADVRNLPLPDNTFDLVVSTLSMHHWRHPAEGIRECLRVTAPGGRCWIYDLRTDVPVKTLADFVTGKGFSRLVLGWIFKFHGLSPEKYPSCTLGSWLQDGAIVQTELHQAYLKFHIEKQSGELQGRAISSKTEPSEKFATFPVSDGV